MIQWVVLIKKNNLLLKFIPSQLISIIHWSNIASESYIAAVGYQMLIKLYHPWLSNHNYYMFLARIFRGWKFLVKSWSLFDKFDMMLFQSSLISRLIVSSLFCNHDDDSINHTFLACNFARVSLTWIDASRFSKFSIMVSLIG